MATAGAFCPTATWSSSIRNIYVVARLAWPLIFTAAARAPRPPATSSPTKFVSLRRWASRASLASARPSAGDASSPPPFDEIVAGAFFECPAPLSGGLGVIFSEFVDTRSLAALATNL